MPETTHKLSKVIAAKSYFSSLYVSYWYNLLRRMFFIPYDDWKMLFLMKVYRYSEGSFYSTAIAFFEASVLKEVRNLCYLRNDNIKVRKYSFCIL